jgi:hypothetical protein
MRAGRHQLLVTGTNYETVSQSSTVRKGDNPVLRVEVVRDGKKVADTREVPVRAGEESEVTFTLPAARVAGK